MNIDTAYAAKEIVKANVTDIYKDSLQPSVRIIGNSLAQCASLLVSPVGRVASIFEKNINKCLDRLDGVAEDNLVEPDPRIAVPVLEKLRYVEDQKVSDYYSEILASASQKDKKNRVMLSYIEILNRVTADELRILEYINSEENKIDISGWSDEEKAEYGIENNARFLEMRGTIPIIDVRIKQKNGYLTLIKNFNNLSEKISLDSDENIAPYIDNLISLGLINKPSSETLAIKPIYKQLKNHKKLSEISLEQDQKINTNEGRIDLTDLCKSLLDLCQEGKNGK
ncbi:MAG: DUF4393 domain-containing protein [Rickettsiales bacterium]|nr:DUF4393 domain-containing protein [Rickettsiales bacterium]